MLWVRGIIFTVLGPVVIGSWLPSVIDPRAHRQPGVYNIGWLVVAAGALIYALCLLRFLAAGGTPAIFFTRHLRFVIGEEPEQLVSSGLYRFSRNPMYLGVLLAVFGQAVAFASLHIAAYGLALFAGFHLVVVLIEEPHLRAKRGPSYELYCQTVPRWLGIPR
jgi:protein-S-isoprenylcysteine O-methyltransferase Ste14